MNFISPQNCCDEEPTGGNCLLQPFVDDCGFTWQYDPSRDAPTAQLLVITRVSDGVIVHQSTLLTGRYTPTVSGSYSFQFRCRAGQALQNAGTLAFNTGQCGIVISSSLFGCAGSPQYLAVGFLVRFNNPSVCAPTNLADAQARISSNYPIESVTLFSDTAGVERTYQVLIRCPSIPIALNATNTPWVRATNRCNETAVGVFDNCRLEFPSLRWTWPSFDWDVTHTITNPPGSTVESATINETLNFGGGTGVFRQYFIDCVSGTQFIELSASYSTTRTRNGTAFGGQAYAETLSATASGVFRVTMTTVDFLPDNAQWNVTFNRTGNNPSSFSGQSAFGTTSGTGVGGISSIRHASAVNGIPINCGGRNNVISLTNPTCVFRWNGGWMTGDLAASNCVSPGSVFVEWVSA